MSNRDCAHCQGTGTLLANRTTDQGFSQVLYEVDCLHCNGTGKNPLLDDPILSGIHVRLLQATTEATDALLALGPGLI